MHDSNRWPGHRHRSVEAVLLAALLALGLTQAASAQVVNGPTQVTATPIIGAAVVTPPLPPFGTRSAIANAAGIPSNNAGVAPPDTVGAVGPNHYVQAVNAPGGVGSLFSVYDKNLNQLAGYPRALNALVPTAGACNTGRGDPIVAYDQFANRWLMLQLTFAATNNLCVYISQGPDPTGAWNLYDFAYANLVDAAGNPVPGGFPDYPKIAIWPNAYYVTTNEGLSGVAALERAAMLAGNNARLQHFSVQDLPGHGVPSFTPASVEGPTAPAANAPGIFMRQVDEELHGYPLPSATQDLLEMWAFTPNFNNLAAATFTQLANQLIPDFDSNLCNDSLSCIAQPAPGALLSAIPNFIMHRLVYRNLAGRQRLIGTFTVDTDGADRVGLRWFELNDTGAGWFVFDQGLYSPDATSRWMASIAMDANRNIALGYSTASPTINPSITYTGRVPTDPAGTMGATVGEINLVTGGGVQTGSSRWGDYSAMVVDPVDDCTFYYTTLFYPATAATNWSTNISSFRLPSCQPPTITVPLTQIVGTATALPAPAGNMQMSAVFSSGSPVNLATAQLTLERLLRQGATERVSGVPVTLTPAPGATPTLATYISLLFPTIAVVVTELPLLGRFVEVTDSVVSISRPAGCGFLFGSASLNTRLRLDDGANPVVVADGTDTWACFGPELVNL